MTSRCGAGHRRVRADPGDRVGRGPARWSIVGCPLRGRPTAGPADPARRPLRAGHRVLRGPDPGPRALRLPVLRARRDPVRDLAPLADRLRGHDRGHVRQHVRRPDDALPADDPTTTRSGLAGDRRRMLRSEPGRDDRAVLHTRGLRLGVRPAARRARTSGSPSSRRAGRRPRLEPSRLDRRVDGPGRPRRRGAPRRPVVAGGRGQSPRSTAPVRGRPLIDLPTWRERRSVGEVGWTGWFRDRLTDTPIRADRIADARARARRPARSARRVADARARRRDPGRSDVPPGRAVPDALRRGLPRADRDGVPPGLALRRVARHLRVDPPAPRQVRDGRRARRFGRGRGQRDERPRGGGPRPPRSSRAARTACSSARAGERVHVATGSEIRTYDLAHARARRGHGRARRVGGRHRCRQRAAARRLRRRRDRHDRARPVGVGGVDIGMEPVAAGDASTTRSSTCS